MARCLANREGCERPGHAQMAVGDVREAGSEGCPLCSLPYRRQAMNSALMPAKEPMPVQAPRSKAPHVAVPPAPAPASRLRLGTMLALPLAAAAGIGLHLAVRK